MNRIRLIRVAVAIAAFAVSLAVYMRTLAPGVGLVDSGELSAAAALLGNAHPPGFPLYLLAVHAVMVVVPVGSFAWRANFATALFAALAAAAMTFAAGELLLLWRRRKKEAPEIIPVAALSLTAGLLLAFSQTLWAYAAAAEVYTLNTAMLLTIIGCMLLWRRTGAVRWMYVAAVMFGLALGIHHVTIGLSLLAIAFLVIRTAGWKFFTTRQLGIAAAISIAALVVVYAYEPLAAMRHPFLNWGDPQSWHNFVNHVTARQYRQYMTTSRAGAQFSFAAQLVTTDFAPRWFPAVLLLAIAGLVQSFRRDRTLFGFIVLLAAANLFWLTIYPIVNDQDAYLLPTLIAVLFAATIGAAELVRIAKGPPVRGTIAAAMLVVPAVAAFANYATHDRSRDWIADDLFDNATHPMARNAILLGGNYEIWSPSTYFQGVEERRPDITIIELALLNRGWYLDALQRKHPELMAKVQTELEAMRPLVKMYESLPPAKWAAMPDEQRAYFAELNRMLVRLVETAGVPVYATREVVTAQDPAIAPMRDRLGQEFEVVPQGVVLQYVRRGTPVPLRPLRLVTRGVADGTIRYDATDVIPTEIVPLYKEAYAMRARYLAAHGDYAEAVAAYDKAIALDPRDATLQRERSTLVPMAQ